MSRLTRKAEKQIKKTITISTIGIVFLTFLVWKFSFFFLDKLGTPVSKDKINNSQTDQTINFIPAPILYPLPQATNSSTIKISGYSLDKKGIIELFINDSVKAKTVLKDDSSFNFDNIALDNGQNIIKVRLKNNSEKFSNFSDPYTTSFIKDGPKLEIKTPEQGAIFSHDDNQIYIQGLTDQENKVTINNYWAIVDSQGNFSYLLTLKNGENNIEITAQNQAGVKSTKNLKVTYQP